MMASFRSHHSSISRQWQLSASVDGFILDLDPAIVDYVFGLLDVYRRGKERIEKIAVSQQGGKTSTPTAVSIEASYQAIRTSNLLLALVFSSGELRLRGLDGTYSAAPTSLDALSDISETIQFPTITVWGEYRATPAATKISGSQNEEPAVVIFRSQVHSTTNKIQPSIFSFLLGFSSRIEERMRRSGTKNHHSEDSAASDVSDSEAVTEGGREFLPGDVLKGIQVSFSLRIDSSKLELGCGNELGVVSALHWESGGFVVTLSPLERTANFAGSVEGLNIDLRHLRYQAGTVQAGQINASNLAFSVSYAHQGYAGEHPVHSISIVVDTEFGAAFRLDRLQDLLVFKAVYIDRLPGNSPQTPPKSDSSGTNRQSIPELTTLILFRARRIHLLADMGHNVALAVFDMENLVLRSRLLKSSTDLSINIVRTNLDLVDDRPLVGYLRLPDFSFSTTRRTDIQLGYRDIAARMLDVRMESGALDLVLQSERRTLFQYRYGQLDLYIRRVNTLNSLALNHLMFESLTTGVRLTGSYLQKSELYISIFP